MDAALARCPLFRGLNDAEAEAALAFFRARRAAYRKGEFPVRPGDPMPCFALVLSGAVEVMMDDLNGHHMIMATAAPGDTFGESLCYLAAPEAPVYVCAVRDTELLWMRTDGMRACLGNANALEKRLIDRFIAMLAARTLSMNDRIQILSKPTLRARLTTLFSQFLARAEGDTFCVPFDRASMATYLGANRSALSRELAAMRAEGLIDFSKNRFTVPRRGRENE